MESYRYLFGPVPSRRLGRSLGVDLNPFKTCSLDCVFCQLGRTTEKTIERREYVPIEAVLAELDKWLKTDGKADYITLSGSGEPTLHSRFGEVLKFHTKKKRNPCRALDQRHDAASSGGARGCSHCKGCKGFPERLGSGIL